MMLLILPKKEGERGMREITLALSFIGLAVCIVGGVREDPLLQNLGLFFTMISVALCILM